jgi:hypothetical protein
MNRSVALGYFGIVIASTKRLRELLSFLIRVSSMNWYVARIALQCQVGENNPGPWTVDEQIRVIQADTHEQAYEKAVRLGNQQESHYLNSEGNMVRWIFLGVSDLDKILDDQITDGTEITYLWHETYDLLEFMREKDETTLFRMERDKHKKASDILSEADLSEDSEEIL